MSTAANDTNRGGVRDRIERGVEQWQSEVGDLQERAAELGGSARSRLREALDELEAGWRTMRERLETMHDEGSEQVAESLEWARERYRELAAVGQRLGDEILDRSDRSERARYFLGPSPTGQWELKRAGASMPMRIFDDKRSALAWSSRYARQHEPSQLVVRRKDGTFQQSRSYGAAPSD